MHVWVRQRCGTLVGRRGERLTRRETLTRGCKCKRNLTYPFTFSADHAGPMWKIFWVWAVAAGPGRCLASPSPPPSAGPPTGTRIIFTIFTSSYFIDVSAPFGRPGAPYLGPRCYGNFIWPSIGLSRRTASAFQDDHQVAYRGSLFSGTPH